MIEHPKKRAFLAAYVETGTIRGAAAAVGIARNSHYNWLKGDPVYAEAFALARDDAADVLEAEARRRATNGTRRYLYYGGEPIMVTNADTGEREHAYEVVRSDILLIFMLKAARPETYRDRFDIRQQSNRPNVVVTIGKDRDVTEANPYDLGDAGRSN